MSVNLRIDCFVAVTVRFAVESLANHTTVLFVVSCAPPKLNQIARRSWFVLLGSMLQKPNTKVPEELVRYSVDVMEDPIVSWLVGAPVAMNK